MTMTLTEALSLTLQQPWTIDDIKPDIIFKVNTVIAVTTDSKDSKTSAVVVAKITLSSAADFEAAAKIINSADEKQFETTSEKTPADAKTLLSKFQSQAWVNAALTYEKQQNWIEAIRCFRNAIYKAPDQKLKGSIYFRMQLALENKTTITERHALKKLCYLEASMAGHVLTSSINAKIFAAQLIENAARNKISSNDISDFLIQDCESNIITITDEYEIKKQFVEILAAATSNNDLAYSLKKYPPEFVLDFLAASELHLVNATILTHTLLGKLYADDIFSTLNNPQRREAFRIALLFKFKEKKFDISTVVTKFKEQLKIIINKQIEGYKDTNATKKAKKTALTAITVALSESKEKNFDQELNLVNSYKNNKTVMEGNRLTTKTASLLNKLALVLPILNQALTFAIAKDEQAVPVITAATASATTDSKHAAADTVSATATTMVSSTATATSAPAVSSGNDTKESGFGTVIATHPTLITTATAAVVSAPVPTATTGVAGAASQPAASEPKPTAAPTPTLV